MALFRRILVPHDFSSHAGRALELAVELARASHGRILVLNVIPPYQPIMAVPEETAWVPPPPPIASERRRLEALVAKTVRGRKTPLVTCQVVLGDPFRCIVDAARGADTIIMSTAGRTGLSHLLIGSVAERVVRHSPVPVVTFRPGAVGPSARRPRRVSRRPTARRAARRS